MTLSQTLFSFKGRINRAKYWTIHLLMLVVGVIMFLIGFPINKAVISADNVAVSAFLLLYVIFAFWIGLAVNVKRWHDLDKSGWSELTRVTAFFALGFRRGTHGQNRFGSDPLEYS